MPLSGQFPHKESKQGSTRDIVVFWILRASSCDECGEELGDGRFLRREGERALCLSCADLDHLAFLPSRNAALTRRARKHSPISPVVVRFSRARKRYERQGVLVDEEALARAEQECMEDHEARAMARMRAERRRENWDEQYAEDFARHIGIAFPGCLPATRTLIAERACARHSGRVGRSAAAKRFDETAINLAVEAYLRHSSTDYDRLLAQGMERADARRAVRKDVDRLVDDWRRGRNEPKGEAVR